MQRVIPPHPHRLLTWLFSLLFMAAGFNHFVNPEFYVRIMPPYLPWHLVLVYASGVAEIALGVLLLFPRYSGLAGWGLIALLIAVFPANLHMALNTDLFPAFSPVVLWLRLPMQGVLIACAHYFARRTQASASPTRGAGAGECAASRSTPNDGAAAWSGKYE